MPGPANALLSSLVVGCCSSFSIPSIDVVYETDAKNLLCVVFIDFAGEIFKGISHDVSKEGDSRHTLGTHTHMCFYVPISSPFSTTARV